jgi:hypothetical protein
VINVISPRLRLPVNVGSVAILNIRERVLKVHRGVKIPLVQIPYPIIAHGARFFPLSRSGGRQRHAIDSKNFLGQSDVSLLLFRQGHFALLDSKDHRKRMGNVDPTGKIGPLVGKSGPEGPVQEFAYALFYFLQAGDVLCVSRKVRDREGQKVVVTKDDLQALKAPPWSGREKMKTLDRF